MISEKEALKVITKAKNKMVEAYPIIRLWNIQVSFGWLDQASGAITTRSHKYRDACITFSPTAYGDNKALLYEYAIHELYHIVCAPFDLALEFMEEKGIQSTIIQDSSIEPVIVTLTRGFIRTHGNPYQSQ